MKKNQHIVGTLAYACIVLACCLCLPLGTLLASEKAEQAVSANSSQQPSALKGQIEKQSYALGLNAGNKYQKSSLEVDADLFGRGLRDALVGNPPLLTEEEVRTVIADLQSELKRKQSALLRELPLKNRQEGEAFLSENGDKEEVVTLESGLQYIILKIGDGQKPLIDDTVVGLYRGTFIDGTVFASSLERDRPAIFAVKGVIKGWAEALLLMPVGSKWRLFIPSNLAYGERGGGRDIGSNATLILEVELITIKAAAQAGNLNNIKTSFKLDSRLTRGLYMGDRWVSPPTYTGVRQEGNAYTVEARVQGVDAKGGYVLINPEWIPSDREMVSVAPVQGNAVKITVKRAGESQLKLAARGFSKDLLIKATRVGKALQVEISQERLGSE